MTNMQQTDLNNWKEDQSQELPASLDNLLIEDCLEELKNETTRNKFNSLIPAQNANARVSKHNNQIEFGYADSWTSHNWVKLTPVYQFFNLQLFLSRTPDVAVMPFLDVPAKDGTIKVIWKNEFRTGLKTETVYHPDLTLDNLLYNKFAEALRIGKNLENAIKIINKIYILSRYA
jgi:hypothetical protein